jgi:DNA-binding winged helix-turn-helix (wHTH) protein/tetratricopeptide (TPR) repeat protein
MNVIHRTVSWLPRIDLAREPQFSLGELKVRPSRREVETGEVRQVLQPRIMQVLVALAHPSSDVVSQDELISRCWGGLTVGEDAVARCISQLRRIAASWPEPPFQIETIPGVGYRMTPTAVAAQPSGTAAPAGAPPRQGRAPWLALAGAGILAVLAVTAILGLHPWPRARSTTPNPTIAVLGFQPVGAGAGEKALAAALQRRVADALSSYNVTVVSGPGAGADFTVDGRVADTDGRLHVIADLTDPHSHVLVYSFDTTVPDDPKGDVASEVASHVAGSLEPFQISSTLRGKQTAADYVLIARANHAVDNLGWLADLDQLRKLADRHPEDADVRASVAIAAIKAAEAPPPDQRPQLIQLARESIARAERLNPNSAGIPFAKALLQNGPLSDPEREGLFRKSLSLNPDSPIAYMELGATMLRLGRTEEGAGLIKRAAQLDPMSYALVSSAVAELFWAGRVQDANQVLDHLARTWPDSERVAFSRYSIAFVSGDMEQVLAVDRQYHLSIQADGQRALNHQSVQLGGQRALTVEAARARDASSVQRLADDCAVEYGRTARKTDAWICPIALTRLGRLDDAFRLAALAYPDLRGYAPSGADAWLLSGVANAPPTAMLFSPQMKPFRDDPRFWEVAVRTGLVDYWRTTGFWPDFCQSQLDSCKRLAAAAALAHPAPPLRG